MPYCAKCGSEMSEMVLFCGVCGAEAVAIDSPIVSKNAQKKDAVMQLMHNEIKKMRSFPFILFENLDTYEQNTAGQFYVELTVQSRTSLGERRENRVCAVGQENADGSLYLLEGSPQIMADFAKSYLAKKTLGFR